MYKTTFQHFKKMLVLALTLLIEITIIYTDKCRIYFSVLFVFSYLSKFITVCLFVYFSCLETLYLGITPVGFKMLEINLGQLPESKRFTHCIIFSVPPIEFLSKFKSILNIYV